MKNGLVSLLCLVLLLSICGCGVKTANDEEIINTQSTEEPIVEEKTGTTVQAVQKETPNIGKLSEDILEATAPVEEEVPRSVEVTETLTTSQKLIGQGIPLINLNETVAVPNAGEFYVDRTDIAKRIDPPTPVQYYNYYEAGDGKQLVDVCISYKNLKTTDVKADAVGSAYISYAGKYLYNCFSVIEEQNRGNFTYTNITSVSPLTTEYIHYMSNVPDEIVESNGEIIAVLTIDGQKNHIILREGEVGDLIPPSENAINDTSGNIGLNQTVSVENVCELTPESVNTSKTVYPYNPSEYTIFFEAGEGKQFIDLCVKYKNMTTRAVRADNLIKVTLQFDGNYTFNPSTAIEQDNRTTLFYTNITYVEPLTSEYIHYFFEVPDEVANNNATKLITLKIGNNTYALDIS